MIDKFLDEIKIVEDNIKQKKVILKNDITILSQYFQNILKEDDKYNRAYIYSSIYEKEFLKENKEKAAFYTNLDIAYEMIKLSLNNYENLSNKKILDPCVWSGIFIFALIKYVEFELKITNIQDFLNKNVFTSDLDKDSTDFFLFILKEVFNIEFKNNSIISFFDINDSYDIIIWNPPYWLSLPEVKDHLLMLEIIKNENISKWEISNDSYWLFYIKAYNILKEWWNICFITPSSFLNIKQHYWLRKLIINDLDSVILLNNNVFKNKITKLKPWIETVICKIDKNSKKKTFDIINNINIKYNENENFNIDYSIFKELKKSDISQVYHKPISYYYTEEILNILLNKNLKKISYYFDSAMWIKTADNKKFTDNKHNENFNTIFIKWTSKEEQEYICNIYDYIDFESLVKNPPKNSNIPQEKYLNKKIFKIGIPEIWHKWIIRAFKYKEEYVSNSIWILLLKEEFYSNEFINKTLKILNSKLYKDITKIFSNNIRLEKHVIDNLPFIEN